MAKAPTLWHRPLTPSEFHILLALCEREKHGYAIQREVRRFRAGSPLLGPATLYSTLKRLCAAGLIEHRFYPEYPNQRRRYYRLTKAGLRLARAEAERMLVLVRTAYEKGLLTERRIFGWP
ncbi:MAG TPA: helix-turn-helix transcriptional regulator [Gemmataceae bacterium]|jgi:DNA-binding PadR family transcriptional regulator